MTSQRDVPTVPDNSLAAFVSSVLPEGESKPFINSEQKPDGTTCSFAANDGVSGDGKKQESLPLLNVSNCSSLNEPIAIENFCPASLSCVVWRYAVSSVTSKCMHKY